MHFFYAILLCPLALAAIAPPSPPAKQLAAATAAAAGAPFKIMQVASAGYDASSPAKLAESAQNKQQFNTLSFKVYDPDPKGNATTTKCTLRWAATEQPTDSYIACDDATFNARIGGQSSSTFKSKTWRGASEFGVSVSHGVQDDSMGPAPYNHRRTFAQANLGSGALQCTKDTTDSTRKMCKLKAGKQVTMTVVGVSA